MFPCGHSFHRNCMKKKIKNYTTKDPAINNNVRRLNHLFDQIDKLEMAKQQVSSMQQSQNQQRTGGGIPFNLGRGFDAGISNLLGGGPAAIRGPIPEPEPLEESKP